MGLGAVLRAPDGALHTLCLLSEGRGCNNEAELLALMAAMRELQQRKAAAVLIHSDNSVMVEQLTKPDAAPIARLTPLLEDARALFRSFASARLVWVPRHRNREADVLARAALGLAPGIFGADKRRRGFGGGLQRPAVRYLADGGNDVFTGVMKSSHIRHGEPNF